jgi:hypothetical protein
MEQLKLRKWLTDRCGYDLDPSQNNDLESTEHRDLIMIKPSMPPTTVKQTAEAVAFRFEVDRMRRIT